MKESWDRYGKISAKLATDAKDDCYALYQQATQGDNTTAKPSSMWFEAKRQWEAWTAKKGMSKEDASVALIKKVRTL